MNRRVKHICSVVSFIAAIVMGFIALFLPPTGIIDSSVLWFTAQLLVFTAGLLGIDLNLGNASTKKVEKDSDNKE